MRTLYIDVYFLINFTVDILSLYFAATFSKVPTSSKKLIFSSLVGAVISVICVFLNEYQIIRFFVASVGLFLMGYIAPNKVSVKRRIKFIISFFIFSALTGGIVTFVWSFLDKYASNFF